MEPQLLFVKFGGVVYVAKEQTVLDNNNATRSFLQTWIVTEQLMRKYEQIHNR